MNESYYDILKVPETCSSKDVRDAFITLSKQNHPDKHLNDPTMHERFIRINEAYSVLINPLSRRAYDINLHHKKKLGAPESEYETTQNPIRPKTGPRTKPSQSSSSGSKTNYSSSSYTQGDPFTFHFHTSGSKEKKFQEDDAYYGIKGVKKVSNRRVASVVILVTFVAVIIQFFTIRSSVIKSREKIMDNNRKYALIHAMAKEKARLYGNDYQINLLKKSLKDKSSQQKEDEDPQIQINMNINNNDSKLNNNPSIQQPQIVTSENLENKVPAESCQKCKKIKRL